MNTNPCLSEEQLVLCHYRELPSTDGAVRHVESCAVCRSRLEQLGAELRRLPGPSIEVDDISRARLAARVAERIQRPAFRWQSVLGGAVVAVALLVVGQIAWSPAPTSPPVPAENVQVASGPAEVPDPEMLEELDLLENLEILQQIEGV